MRDLRYQVFVKICFKLTKPFKIKKTNKEKRKVPTSSQANPSMNKVKSLNREFESVVSPADTTSASGDCFALAAFQAVQASSCTAPTRAGRVIAHY